MEDQKRVPIEGYEGCYLIGKDGTILSLDREVQGRKKGSVRKIKGRELKPGKTDQGYLIVELSKNGKTKMSYVHRLVAQHYLDNFEGKDFVNHLDGDRTNNHVENLEWVTPLENAQHAVANGFIKQRGANHPKSVTVTDSELGIFDTISHFCKIRGITHSKAQQIFKDNTIAQRMDTTTTTTSTIAASC